MTFEQAKRRVAEYITDYMIRYGRYGGTDHSWNDNRIVRIDDEYYNIGSPDVWNYWDQDGLFWNQNFEDDESVGDLPDEPPVFDEYGNTTEYEIWCEKNREHRQSDNPYWDSDKCAQDRKNFIDWLCDNNNSLFDDPIDDTETEADFEFDTDK